jgi:hypothetical protein
MVPRRKRVAFRLSTRILVWGRFVSLWDPIFFNPYPRVCPLPGTGGEGGNVDLSGTKVVSAHFWHFAGGQLEEGGS